MDENSIYRELIDLIKTELAEPYEYDGETSQKVLFTIYGAVMLAENLMNKIRTHNSELRNWARNYCGMDEIKVEEKK